MPSTSLSGSFNPGSGSGSGIAEEIEAVDSENLFNLIDRDNVHGLNLAVPESAKEIIKPWAEREDTERFVDSGTDADLMLHIPFVSSIHLRSILLKTARGELHPSRMRIYANYSTIVDFSDTADLTPQLDIQLSDAQNSGGVGGSVVVYPLTRASPAFARVNSLSIFFSDAPSDVSRIYYLGFRGTSHRFTAEGSQKLEVRAENAAEAPLVDRLKERAAGAQSFAR